VEISFGDHVLDLNRRELRGGVELIAIEPQVFDLLIYLVQNRDRVVSKDDLLATVWGGRIVSESTLTSRIKRGAPSGRRQRRGPAADPHGTAQGNPLYRCRRSGPERCSTLEISTDLAGQAVNRSASVCQSEQRPEQEYFADGMVEEIITALSRIGWLLVIARNSSFTYRGQAIDVRQVGQELGVRYVLEGSVRKAVVCALLRS
jgi:Transcriptional regulatory protein, C terminal